MPSSNKTRSLTQRRSVDLPEPDAPIKQTTSCSSTKFLPPNKPSYDQFTKKSKKKKVIITLKDGDLITGKQIIVTADSTSLMESGMEIRSHIPTRQIETISIKNKSKGILRGLGIYVLTSPFLFFFSPLIALSTILFSKGPLDNYIMDITEDSKKTDEKFKYMTPYRISNRISPIISLSEKNTFNLFPNIKDFHSAKFLKISDDTYIMEMTTIDTLSGEKRIIREYRTKADINQYKLLIEK